MIYVESGGREDGPVVVLLHGSGASGAVWRPVRERLGERCRWLVPDLPGHGRSSWLDDYAPESYADAVAGAITESPVIVVGHSLGGMIALSLADGSHGFDVASVVVIAMRVAWTDEELERRAALATKPAKIFPAEAQAREFFGRVSGMRAAPFTDEDRASGVTSAPDGYRLSGDPNITAAPPATAGELAALMGGAKCPVELACGDRDPGIDPADMERALGRPVTVLPATGHNAHIEQPGLVADLVDQALRR